MNKISLSGSVGSKQKYFDTTGYANQNYFYPNEILQKLALHITIIQLKEVTSFGCNPDEGHTVNLYHYHFNDDNIIRRKRLR